ncbi:ciliary microtubule inner protein 1 [Sorex fumeus]|uniref:ciliary microtubule inner protein 1 n=1 Tax=Sorex fumeus TaxID=62283 RepID=UPI0024ADD3BF|nr:ciliary microtubule inner protein 1 [Sorex fumeus]
MAQRPLSTAEAERMNLVAQDAIWKYRLKAEKEARQSWAQRWGFLAGPVEELALGDEPAPGKPRVELPEHLRVPPVHSVEKDFKILPSPPVPETTQGFIGWRSGKPGLSKYLELDSQIRSCKGAYAKQLDWPEQGIY